MTPPIKMLLMMVNETDRVREAPLYEALVQLLHRLGVAGATAQAGVMGFGRRHRVHHKGLFGIPDDRPITIVAVDEEQRLRALLPQLRELAGSAGIMLLLDVELVR